MCGCSFASLSLQKRESAPPHAVLAEELLQPAVPMLLAEIGGQAEPGEHAAGFFGDRGGALGVRQQQSLAEGVLGGPGNGGREDGVAIGAGF